MKGVRFVFSDNYIRLCNEYEKAVTTVAEELGFSKASGAKWANGSKPRKTTLAKIAKYFGVTVDELTKDKKENPPHDGDGLTEVQKDLITLIRQLDPDAVRFLKAKAQELAEFQQFRDSQ